MKLKAEAGKVLFFTEYNKFVWRCQKFVCNKSGEKETAFAFR